MYAWVVREKIILTLFHMEEDFIQYYCNRCQDYHDRETDELSSDPNTTETAENVQSKNSEKGSQWMDSYGERTWLVWGVLAKLM